MAQPDTGLCRCCPGGIEIGLGLVEARLADEILLAQLLAALELRLRHGEL
jgi:hypothetical protein